MARYAFGFTRHIKMGFFFHWPQNSIPWTSLLEALAALKEEEEDSPLFMGCKVIFSMLRLISDSPCAACCWLRCRCCCDATELELLVAREGGQIPDDLKSDLLPLNLLVALANRLLMTSSWSLPPTPIAAATAI